MNQQTTRAQSATEILKTAASTLGERGKQYDPNGKQERSMTAIVAAFNAIFPAKPITVHQGWQFMCLVKMVRGATKPHADSALDQVAYAALAAESVAEQLHQPEPAKQPVDRCASPKAQVCMTKEQVLAGQSKHEAQVAELTGKCVAQSSRISELQTLVDNLRSLLAQATKEAPCAHNTDEPKAAPRPEYVDPFDQYGDMRSPRHRLVGDRDPARGGLAYPAGKDAPTPL